MSTSCTHSTSTHSTNTHSTSNSAVTAGPLQPNVMQMTTEITSLLKTLNKKKYN